MLQTTDRRKKGRKMREIGSNMMEVMISRYEISDFIHPTERNKIRYDPMTQVKGKYKKKVLLLLSLPSPASFAHLGSCDQLFLVHNTQAWLPKKKRSRTSCLSSFVIFYKPLPFPSRRLTMFFSLPAHFLKICKDWPACSMPGVANTTWKVCTLL